VPAKSSETRAILLLILGHTEHLRIRTKNVCVKVRTSSKTSLGSNCCDANFLRYNDPFQNQEQKLAKKSKKKVARREYSKADVRELRAHSKAKTPVEKIAKLTKRTVGALRQKALKLGIGLGHQRWTERRIGSSNAQPTATRSVGYGADRHQDDRLFRSQAAPDFPFGAEHSAQHGRSQSCNGALVFANRGLRI
jgi:hypothetical protein